MPHYVSLVRWTDQGIKEVKDSPKRAEAFLKLVEKLGGKAQLFYTMGKYDLVALIEAPNDDIAMQAALQVGSLGSVRTTTLKAFTPFEAAKIIAKIQ